MISREAMVDIAFNITRLLQLSDRQAGELVTCLSLSQIFKQRISFLISRVLYISWFYIKFGWCVVVVIRGMFTTQ